MTAPLRIPIYGIDCGDTGGQRIPISVRLSSYHDGRLRTSIPFEMMSLICGRMDVFELP